MSEILQDPDIIWIICHNATVALPFTGDVCFPTPAALVSILGSQHQSLKLQIWQLGVYKGCLCYGVELVEYQVPHGYKFFSLRSLISVLSEFEFNLLGRAIQLIRWDKEHQFCSQCAQPLLYMPGETAKRCKPCALVQYPKLAPCVLVLVYQSDRILLAHGVRHPKGLYSALAGFIEPGETVEQAVHREVQEEVGVQLNALQYVASQAWPFPHALMLGFLAAYESGSLLPEPQEITDAQWFQIDNLPNIPPQGVLARTLIDTYRSKLGR